MSDLRSATGRVISQAFRWWSRNPEDLDGDGLPNDQDPNAHNPDTGGDGIADGAEVEQGTDP